MLNSTVLQNGNSNLNSPHINQRISGQFIPNNNSKTPTQLLQTNDANVLTLSSSSHHKKNSSNNLLSNVINNNTTATNEYESPTVINSNSNVNNRLSRNRNNMSNNNLSTSASLLDATTDDAMSSMCYETIFINK